MKTNKLVRVVNSEVLKPEGFGSIFQRNFEEYLVGLSRDITLGDALEIQENILNNLSKLNFWYNSDVRATNNNFGITVYYGTGVGSPHIESHQFSDSPQEDSFLASINPGKYFDNKHNFKLSEVGDEKADIVSFYITPKIFNTFETVIGSKNLIIKSVGENYNFSFHGSKKKNKYIADPIEEYISGKLQ